MATLPSGERDVLSCREARSPKVKRSVGPYLDDPEIDRLDPRIDEELIFPSEARLVRHESELNRGQAAG